ncbi:MAG: hypothetical protein FWG69_00910 [Oscillospiraceae bacterium]|nr:hypothetical protein [Oscillospiraceae bacterium]
MDRNAALRQHPVKIIEGIFKYLLLFILPALRSAAALMKQGLTPDMINIWLQSIWLDFLIAALIITPGFIKWLSVSFVINSEGIFVRKGLFRISGYSFSYDSVTSILLEKPFYLAGLGAVRIKIACDTRLAKKGILSLTVKRIYGIEIMRRSLEQNRTEAAEKMSYSPQFSDVADMSLKHSSGLRGILIAVSLTMLGGKLIGRELQDMVLENLDYGAKAVALSASIPHFAAVVSVLLSGGWIVSFIINLLRYRELKVIRQGGSLYARWGMLSVREYSIKPERVDYISIINSRIAKTAKQKRVSVFLHSTGYASGKGELAVLVPAAQEDKALDVMSSLLPEIKPVEKQISPPKRALIYYIFPAAISVLVTVSATTAAQLIPVEFYKHTVSFVFLSALFPLGWLLRIKVQSFYYSGIGIKDDTLTLYYQKNFKFFKVSVLRGKSLKIVIRQNLLHRKAGLCHIVVYPDFAKRHKHIIKNMDIKTKNIFS